MRSNTVSIWKKPWNRPWIKYGLIAALVLILGIVWLRSTENALARQLLRALGAGSTKDEKSAGMQGGSSTTEVWRLQSDNALDVDVTVNHSCEKDGNNLVVTIWLGPIAYFEGNEFFYSYFFSDGVRFERQLDL